jgi:hypothetical protein
MLHELKDIIKHYGNFIKLLILKISYEIHKPFSFMYNFVFDIHTSLLSYMMFSSN